MTQGNSKDTDRIEVRKEYYESGAIMWESPFVNGAIRGIEKSYYESGAIRYEAPYEDGHIHGVAKVYYESGALWYEAPYKDGYMHGIAKTYDKDNINIDRLTLYNNNRKVSTLCLESYKASSV